MPWTETCIMEERVKFVMDVLDETYCMVELCSYYASAARPAINVLSDTSRASVAPPSCAAITSLFAAGYEKAVKIS